MGGDALSLAELENYHPEEGAILANTTSIGMHPAIDQTPLSKVTLFSLLFAHAFSQTCEFCSLSHCDNIGVIADLGVDF